MAPNAESRPTVPTSERKRLRHEHHGRRRRKRQGAVADQNGRGKRESRRGRKQTRRSWGRRWVDEGDDDDERGRGSGGGCKERGVIEGPGRAETRRGVGAGDCRRDYLKGEWRRLHKRHHPSRSLFLHPPLLPRPTHSTLSTNFFLKQPPFYYV